MIVPGVNKERIASFIEERYRELRTKRGDLELTWLDCINAYLGNFDENTVGNSAPGRSKRFYGVSNDAVETIHSQLMAMVFPPDQWMFVEPDIEGSLDHDDEAAEQSRRLLELRVRRARFKAVASGVIKQLIILGNCPYTVSWHREHMANYPAYAKAMAEWASGNRQRWEAYLQERQRYVAVVEEAQRAGLTPPPPPQFQIPEPPASGGSKVAYSGPRIEMGDIFNFVVDPYAIDPRTALRIRRIWVSRETVRAMSRPNEFGYSVYSDVDEIDDLQETDRAMASDDHQSEIYAALGMQMPTKDSVELLEAWGTMEIPGEDAEHRDVRVSYCATIANGKTIRFEPTFLWDGSAPLRLATYNNIPGHVYGVGALEPNLGTQNLINARANQLVDVTAYAINPEYRIRLDGVVDPQGKSAPGRRHPVADMDNLQPIPKDLRGVQVAHQELQTLIQEFRSMTRALSPAMGGSKQSATRTALDANIVGTDLGKTAAWIEDEFVTEALGLFVQLDRQFITKDELAKLTQSGDTPLKDLSPEAFMKGCGVRARGSRHFADKMEQIQGLAAWIQMASSNQFLLPITDFMYLGRKYYQLLGFHDTDKAFNDNARAQEILDQMFANGLIGGSANGNGGGIDGDPGGSAGTSPTSEQPGQQGGNQGRDAGSPASKPRVSDAGGDGGSDS